MSQVLERLSEQMKATPVKTRMWSDVLSALKDKLASYEPDLETVFELVSELNSLTPDWLNYTVEFKGVPLTEMLVNDGLDTGTRGQRKLKHSLDYDKLFQQFVKETHYFKSDIYKYGSLFDGRIWKILDYQSQNAEMGTWITKTLEGYDAWSDKNLRETKAFFINQPYDADKRDFSFLKVRPSFKVTFSDLTYDAETGQTYLPRWDDYIINYFPVSIKDAQNPFTWKGWAEYLVGKDGAQTLYEITGLMFLPTAQLRKSFFLQGPGQNGKSEYLKRISRLLGVDNIASTQFATLTRSNEEENAKAEFANKTAWIIQETQTGYIEQVDTIKALLGGDDMDGRPKGKNTLHFTSTVSGLFAVNETLPTFKLDSGVKTRFGIIKTVAESMANNGKLFAEVSQRFGKDKTDSEAGGFVLFCLEQAMQAIRVNQHTESETNRTATAEWFLNSNPTQLFVDEYGVLFEGDYSTQAGASTPYVYQWYKTFSQENGNVPLSLKNFKAKIVEYGHTIKSKTVANWSRDTEYQNSIDDPTKQKDRFVGLGIRTPDEPTPKF